MGRGRGSQVIRLRNTFSRVNECIFLRQEKLHEQCQFYDLCLKICMEEKKPVGLRFFWNLTSSIVFTVGQMLSRTLDGLYFCAT